MTTVWRFGLVQDNIDISHFLNLLMFKITYVHVCLTSSLEFVDFKAPIQEYSAEMKQGTS